MTMFAKLALFAILVAPAYQTMTSTSSHKETVIEGETLVKSDEYHTTYGDNFLKNILGLKTVYGVYNSSSPYNNSKSTIILTPTWMQKIGCKKELSWGEGYIHESSLLDNLYVVGLRMLVKLAIAFICILLSAMIQAAYEKRFERGGLKYEKHN